MSSSLSSKNLHAPKKERKSLSSSGSRPHRLSTFAQSSSLHVEETRGEGRGGSKFRPTNIQSLNTRLLNTSSNGLGLSGAGSPLRQGFTTSMLQQSTNTRTNIITGNSISGGKATTARGGRGANEKTRNPFLTKPMVTMSPQFGGGCSVIKTASHLSSSPKTARPASPQHSPTKNKEPSPPPPLLSARDYGFINKFKAPAPPTKQERAVASVAETRLKLVQHPEIDINEGTVPFGAEAPLGSPNANNALLDTGDGSVGGRPGSSKGAQPIFTPRMASGFFDSPGAGGASSLHPHAVDFGGGDRSRRTSQGSLAFSSVFGGAGGGGNALTAGNNSELFAALGPLDFQMPAEMANLNTEEARQQRAKQALEGFPLGKTGRMFQHDRMFAACAEWIVNTELKDEDFGDGGNLIRGNTAINISGGNNLTATSGGGATAAASKRGRHDSVFQWETSAPSLFTSMNLSGSDGGTAAMTAGILSGLGSLNELGNSSGIVGSGVGGGGTGSRPGTSGGGPRVATGGSGRNSVVSNSAEDFPTSRFASNTSFTTVPAGPSSASANQEQLTKFVSAANNEGAGSGGPIPPRQRRRSSVTLPPAVATMARPVPSRSLKDSSREGTPLAPHPPQQGSISSVVNNNFGSSSVSPPSISVENNDNNSHHQKEEGNLNGSSSFDKNYSDGNFGKNLVSNRSNISNHPLGSAGSSEHPSPVKDASSSSFTREYKNLSQWIADLCAEIEKAPNLNHLMIHHTALRRVHLTALCEHGLTKMCLSNVLHKLSLTFCGLSALELRPLFEWVSTSPNAQYLTHLDLSHNRLTNDALDLLREGLHAGNCQLQYLNVRNNQTLGEEGAVSLLYLLNECISTLQGCDMGFCNLGDSTIVKLASILQRKECRLTHLLLDGCNVSQRAGAIFLDSVELNRSLLYLSLKYIYYCNGRVYLRRVTHALKKNAARRLRQIYNAPSAPSNTSSASSPALSPSSRQNNKVASPSSSVASPLRSALKGGGTTTPRAMAGSPTTATAGGSVAGGGGGSSQAQQTLQVNFSLKLMEQQTKSSGFSSSDSEDSDEDGEGGSRGKDDFGVGSLEWRGLRKGYGAYTTNAPSQFAKKKPNFGGQQTRPALGLGAGRQRR